MESFEKRLKRFSTSSLDEVPLTILNSIANFFLPELRLAKEYKLDRLIFLGTHAIIQTVSERLFRKRGPKGTRFYFESFVDGSTYDTKFSLVSDSIHAMRNVYAHQWISTRTHNITIDYRTVEGWKKEADGLHINPDIYAQHFLDGFGMGERIWNWDQMMTHKDLNRRSRKMAYAA